MEMKKSSLIFIFNLFFFIFQLVVPANSLTDSCDTHVNFNDLLDFDFTSFSCQSVWQQQDFILRYSKAKPNTWSFLVSAPNKGGYVAMGFSTNGEMIGSSAIVGWPWRENGSTGKMKQYYLGGKKFPEVKPDEGALNVVNNSMAVFVQSSRIYLAFQLTASQPSNLLIFAVGSPGFQPRSPKYQLQEHSERNATQIDYASGQIATQKSPYAGLRKDHGIVNIFSWGILVPLGTLTARYLRRWDPIWFYSHVAIQIVGFILGLTGIILGFVLQGLLNVGDTITHHKGIGVTILIFACLQVTALLARPEKGSKTRKYWNWYHHYAGRLIIILSVVNIFYGIQIAEEGVGWSVFYGFILVIMIIAAIFGEIKLRRQD